MLPATWDAFLKVGSFGLKTSCVGLDCSQVSAHWVHSPALSEAGEPWVGELRSPSGLCWWVARGGGGGGEVGEVMGTSYCERRA